MKSEEGADYGPVTRAELDAWHAEGRVTADCQLLREGSEQWQWASDVYSDLVEEEEPAAPSLAAAEEITEEDNDEEPASVFAPRAPQKTTPQKTSPVKAGVKATPLKSVPNQASGARRGAKKVFAAPPEEDEDETDDSDEQPQLSTRSKVTAGLLGLFLGPLGIHRFYLGYAGLGLAMLFTLGGCGIWSLTDAILIFLGKVPDAEGNPLRD